MSQLSAKVAALNALDVLLSVQTCSKIDKITALREIEKTAKRMADGIVRREMELNK